MNDSSPEEMIERVVTETMCEVLALESTEVDPDDNLSEYGFDSITLTEFASTIVRRFPFMKLDASTFLELPTLSRLSSHLATKYRTEILRSMEAAPLAGRPSVEQLQIEIDTGKTDITAASENAPAARSHAQVREADIAIIGMAGRFPEAENVGEFWKILVQERSTFSKVPAERWDWRDYFGDPGTEDGKTDCCHGAFLDDVARFDAMHFGISPAEAELLDPQHRLLLEVAWETIENAGYRKGALQQRRVGVFVGLEKQDYKELLNKSRFELDPYTNTGNTHSVLVNRLSHFFDWRGPSIAVDTACSSSLAAIAQACDSLRSGRVEMALAGGINLLLTPWVFVVNRKLGMLTNEPVMRPFDRRASGHVNGEGVGLILLKKLSSAIADRDIIYGVIRGISVQHGGRGVFLTAPNPAGHQAVIQDALLDAGLEAGDIEYIEAQGTADQASDRVELKTYQAVFGGSRARPVMIGTSKGNVGHLGAASGVAAIIKTVLSLKNNMLPRVLNLEHVNWTDDDGQLQCECVSRTQDWTPRTAGPVPMPRRAGVHNFGYGGVSAHAILEEHLALAPSRHESPPAGASVVVLSARTHEQLMRYAGDLLAFIRNRDYQHYGIGELNLSELSYTLQVGREPMEYRLAMVVDTLPELEQTLNSWCRGDSRPALVFSGKAREHQNDTLNASHAVLLCGAASGITVLPRGAASGIAVLPRGAASGIAVLPRGAASGITVSPRGAASGIAVLPRGAASGIAVSPRGAASGIAAGQERLSATDAAGLAQSWVAGEEVPWAGLYGERTPQRIPLPAYPFARDRYWIPQEEVVPELDVSRSKNDIVSGRPEESTGCRHDPVVKMLVARDLKQQVCSLLKVKPGQLDEHRNFVDSGFTSLTLTQFARNVSARFGIEVRPPTFFSYPSIHRLSDHLASSYRPALEAFYELKTASEPNAREATSPPARETTKKRSQARARMDRQSSAVSGQDEPIAVIGMSGRFPGADSIEELWSILAAGKSAISEIPRDRWDWREYYRGPGDAANRIATNRGGFMTGVAEFDPLFFDLSPREAELTDPRHRLLLQEAWRAFEDAGYAGRRIRGTSCGVFVGVEEGEYEKQTGDEGLLTGNHNGVLASRISYALDLQGPSLAINTACSSGLAAVHLACQSLQRGETDMALAGAVHLLLSPGLYQQLTRMGMLSESGQCFAFGQRADGIVPAEAVAALVLKRLSAAIDDGDHIYGVIRGCGLNYKGKTNGMTAPSGLSQRRVIEETYQKCGVHAGDIDYVAAHGTGTRLGDPIEVAALEEAFRASTAKTGYCALGAVTANVGHTFAVSGIVSMIAVLLGLTHKTIPAALNDKTGNDGVSLSGSPFYISTTSVPWIPQPGKRRLAAVSAFGISGTNAHVVLEEPPLLVAPEPATAGEDQGPRSVIVPLSARNDERLREYAGRLLAHLQNGVGRMGEPGLALADLAYTLQTGRDAMECRVAFVVKETRALVRGLGHFLAENPDVNCCYGRAQRELAILQTIGADEDMQGTIRRWMGTGKQRHVAALWVIGADIDWELFRHGDERRISLPAYPFARRTCWFHSHHEAPAADAPRHSLVSSDSHPTAPDDRAVLDIPVNGTLRVTPTPERLTLPAIERDVTRHVCEAMLLDESEVDVRKKFVDMGLSSVIGVELVNRLNDYYDLTFSATRLYDYANIVELARFIHAELAGGSGAMPLAAPSGDTAMPLAAPPGDTAMPLAAPPGDTAEQRVAPVPLVHPADRTADSVEEQVRDVLRQLAADALTLEDAEELIVSGMNRT